MKVYNRPTAGAIVVLVDGEDPDGCETLRVFDIGCPGLRLERVDERYVAAILEIGGALGLPE